MNGVLLIAALTTPLIPLLRVTDLAAGRAAAGIAVIAAALGTLARPRD